MEKVIQEKQGFYNVNQVRTYLMTKEFADTGPLLHLCSVHDFYDVLLPYLYDLKDLTSIAIYIVKLDTSVVK